MAIAQMAGKPITSLSLEAFRRVDLHGMPRERRTALASELRYTIAPAMRERLADQKTMQNDLHVHTSDRFPSSAIFDLAGNRGVGTMVLTDHNHVRNVFADWRHAASRGVDCTFGGVMLSFHPEEGGLVQTKVYYNPFDPKIPDMVADIPKGRVSATAIENTLQKFSERGCWIVLAYPGRYLSQGIDPKTFSDALKELSKRGILHGIETNHSGHNIWESRFLKHVAIEAGLCEDGGSDFPGSHVGEFASLGSGIGWNVDIPFFIIERIRGFLTAPLLTISKDLANTGKNNEAFHKLWQALMIDPYDFDTYKKASRILENAA